MHFDGSIIRIYHDARSSECKIRRILLLNGQEYTNFLLEVMDKPHDFELPVIRSQVIATRKYIVQYYCLLGINCTTECF